MAQAVLVEYLLKNKQFKEASKMALSAMSEVSGEVEYARFRSLYVQALEMELEADTAAKKYSQALSLYEGQKKWFSLGSPAVMKNLADVYRGLGLFASSNRYLELYMKEHGARAPASSEE